MNAKMMEEYLKFICNRRLVQIELEEEYPGAKESFSLDVRDYGSKKRKEFL